MRKIVQLYIDTKKYEEAIVVLEGLLKSVPESSDIHYLAGIAYDGKGDANAARQHFERVRPDNRFYESGVLDLHSLENRGETSRSCDPAVVGFILGATILDNYDDCKAFEQFKNSLSMP